MDYDSEIARLLTEIRDNQQRQIESYQKARQEQVEFYNIAQAKQNRRALIAAIVFGVGFGLIVMALAMR